MKRAFRPTLARLSVYASRRVGVGFAILLLILLALTPLASSLVNAQMRPHDQRLLDAWKLAERSGQYRFTSQVTQKTIPAAQMANVDVTHTASINGLTNNFTVGAWIKPSVLPGLGRIVSTACTNSANGFGLGAFGGKLIFTTYGVRDYVGSLDILRPNVWQHVAVHLTPDNDAEFYVNGLLVETVPGSSPTVTPTATPTVTPTVTPTPTPTPGETLDEIFLPLVLR